MSAWSQAVWIVKKIEKNLNISEQISNYITNLNSLNTSVNNLIDEVDTTKTNLQNRAVTILAQGVATPNNTFIPDTERPYGQGAIWLILP